MNRRGLLRGLMVSAAALLGLRVERGFAHVGVPWRARIDEQGRFSLTTPNGSPVRWPDGMPVRVYEVLVTFNGRPCECVEADEARGRVVVLEDTGCRNLHYPWVRRRAHRGKVEIRLVRRRKS